jgi:hypothetical protein
VKNPVPVWVSAFYPKNLRCFTRSGMYTSEKTPPASGKAFAKVKF